MENPTEKQIVRRTEEPCAGGASEAFEWGDPEQIKNKRG